MVYERMKSEWGTWKGSLVRYFKSNNTIRRLYIFLILWSTNCTYRHYLYVSFYWSYQNPTISNFFHRMMQLIHVFFSLVSLYQWWIHKISQRVAVTIKKSISKLIQCIIILLFFRFYYGKMQKKVPQGGGCHRNAVLVDPPVHYITVFFCFNSYCSVFVIFFFVFVVMCVDTHWYWWGGLLSPAFTSLRLFVSVFFTLFIFRFFSFFSSYSSQRTVE